MAAPMERIQSLDTIEKDILTCLQSAGQSLMELSKEKSSLKQAESHTQQFLKSVSSVESKLMEQINYLTQVSTGQPHEGSGYASQKVLQMAWHRLEHARSRVNELERIKKKHLEQILNRQQQLQKEQEERQQQENQEQAQQQSTQLQQQSSQPMSQQPQQLQPQITQPQQQPQQPQTTPQ